MTDLKTIAATLAIMGSGALVLTGCDKDKPATETPAGADAAGDAAEGSCGADKAEGSCGAEGDGSCGAEGDGSCGAEKAEGDAAAEGDAEGDAAAEGEDAGEGSCGA